MRPAEVEQLVGDSSKAKRVLGWQPQTSFEQMIRLMVDSDYRSLQRGARSSAAAAQG
jgi:GDPmannose 4,6-dehydratase